MASAPILPLPRAVFYGSARDALLERDLVDGVLQRNAAPRRPIGRRAGVNPKPFGCLSERYRLSRQINETCRSLIQALNSSCGPSAIARFVALRIIDPVKSGSLRARAHVGDKKNKVFPACANSDSSVTINARHLGAGVDDSFSHRLPRSISRGASHSVRCMVCLGRYLSVETATRRGVAAAHRGERNNKFRTAIAFYTEASLSLPRRRSVLLGL